MKYKMIALDLDDTLTNSKKVITPATKAALMEAQEQGMKVVLASGRTIIGVSPLAEELKLEKYGGYILAFNGARIVDCKTKQEIFTCPVPADRVGQIIDISREKHMPLLTHEDDHLVVEEPEDELIQLEAAINHMPIKDVGDMKKYINFPVYKFIGTGKPEYLEEVMPDIQKALSPDCAVYRSTPFFMEFVAADVDKGVGLKNLAKRAGISMSEVIAVGDGYNDISMIRAAGLGVAMANAQPEVRSSADYITLDNDHDGVAHIFDYINGRT